MTSRYVESDYPTKLRNHVHLHTFLNSCSRPSLLVRVVTSTAPSTLSKIESYSKEVRLHFSLPHVHPTSNE
jgi:hypothetical protein